MSDGDGDPVLMGLIRASHLRDTAARERLAGQIRCPARGRDETLHRVRSLVLGLMWRVDARAMDLGASGRPTRSANPICQMIGSAREGTQRRTRAPGRRSPKRGIATVKNPPPVTACGSTDTVRTFYASTRASPWIATFGPRANCCLPPGRARTRWRWCRCPGTCCSSMPATRVQVGRARQLIAIYQGREPIPVGGSYLDLMLSWHVPVHTTTSRACSSAAWASPRSRPWYRRKGCGCVSTNWRCLHEYPSRPRSLPARRRARLRGWPQPRRWCGHLHRQSFPIRSPISAGPASCRSASAVRASPTSAIRRTSTTHRARSAVVASIRSSDSPLASGSPHGMSRRCANHSAWYRSAASISIRASRRRKRRRFTRPEGDGDGGSFYQAHFYVNPVMYWLEVVTDFPAWKGLLRSRLPHRGRPPVGRRRTHR